MTAPRVAIIATLATKSDEAIFLKDCIESAGANCTIIDASIADGVRGLEGGDKLAAMLRASEAARAELLNLPCRSSLRVVAGIGGGTGAQIAATVLSSVGGTARKVLITTQAFDSRLVPGLEDTIIIPTVTDLEGLNRLTRNVLQGAGAAIAGLARAETAGEMTSDTRLVAITALGVTADGVRLARSALETAGFECAVFHANGFGGNAMANLAMQGEVAGILDFTTHELVSLCLDPETSVAENRFGSLPDCPRVLLPGGVNFLTRIRGRAFGLNYAGRPQYRHSPEFTHIGLSSGEMSALGRSLGENLAASESATAVIMPMGGFSSEDCPGGVLENRIGREAFADAVAAGSGKAVEIVLTDDHINDPKTADIAVGVFRELTGAGEKENHS